MKRHWLGGVLLGVSMALLLSGGVALAQSMSIEPYCNVCCDDWDYPCECAHFSVSSSGWAASEVLDLTIHSPGPWGTATLVDRGMADSEGRYSLVVYVMCPYAVPFEAEVLTNGNELFIANFESGDYGEWTLELEGTSGKVGAQFYFAEDPSDCEVEEEFVPEPGSLLLLGSGLMGLAGYATLRWRTRE